MGAKELRAEIEALAKRLDRGSSKIETARARGDVQEVEKLETFWIGLLGEYERCYDRLEELNG